MMMKSTVAIICTLILIMTVGFSGAENSTPSADSPTKISSNGTVLAVYMIGSNLEFDPQDPSQGGAATKDIKEMVMGYGNKTGNLDVLIGYGGSLKPGWKGITYVTLGQVREDLSDGVIGNSQAIQFKDENADMTEPKTLTSFLQYTKEQYPGARVLLVFWDHGSAWEGFGIDDNFHDRATGDYHLIPPQDIAAALKNSNVHADLIGFDACLMANMDVALSIAPYGDVLVSSEDLEPGFGWDWKTFLQRLSANPSLTAEELGTIIVDAYIDNPAHTDTGKTLSVIRLANVQELSDKFDSFSEVLSTELTDEKKFKLMAASINRVKAFGTYPILKSGETGETTIDLKDYLTSIAKYNPDKRSDVQVIQSLLNNTVAYSREDGSRPFSNGISIYSPYTAILASDNKAKRTERRGSGFELFLDLFAQSAKSSKLAPQIIQDRGGYTVDDNESYTIGLTFLQNIPEGVIYLGTEPAYPDKPGHYPFPKWGGWGLMWKDKKTDKSLVCPVEFVGYTSKGRERYTAWGAVTRGDMKKNLKFDFYYEPKTGDTEYYVVPYQGTGSSTIYDRSVFKFVPGDILTMTAKYRLKTLSEERREYGSITWTDQTAIGYGMLPCGNYTIMFDVENVARKIVYQDTKEVPVVCGEGVPAENVTPVS
ncbi:MAG TPA: clostripain-related cysteine peptidase [Methanospirillum sp.]|nr:clostripain-related cysteine peptidase [Methanospirillum sp.]